MYLSFEKSLPVTLLEVAIVYINTLFLMTYLFYFLYRTVVQYIILKLKAGAKFTTTYIAFNNTC